MKIAWVQTHLQPIHPTRAYPSPLLPSYETYGPLRNYLSHYSGGWGTWSVMRNEYNQALKETLGLKGFPYFGVFFENEKKGIPALYGFSPSFLPKPRDWAEHIHVTGYWFLDESQRWQPPADLLDFLDSGPAPVYVGFGSMPNENPEATTKMVIDALRKAGQRGILLKGWGALSAGALGAGALEGLENFDDMYVIDSAPHDWLFPRMAAVVHHGGAGTTGAGLRAGKPSILTPHFADQPFWGMRVYERGVGPRPIPRDQLTADNLAAAIREAFNGSGMRERAAKLGEQIRAEDGVGTAVRIIESSVISGQ
jgi:UDP:flavonoid glycosyltransferase YjiC (YdhE family)